MKYYPESLPRGLIFSFSGIFEALLCRFHIQNIEYFQELNSIFICLKKNLKIIDIFIRRWKDIFTSFYTIKKIDCIDHFLAAYLSSRISTILWCKVSIILSGSSLYFNCHCVSSICFLFSVFYYDMN